MSKNTNRAVKMSSASVVINNVNVNTGIIMREAKLLNNPNLWHKVVVQSCGHLPRDFILKAILDDVHPLDFIPVNYSVEGTNASFFARNCRMAIEKLCRQHLVVANPQNADNPFKLMIILAFSDTKELIVNVQENISKVIAKRYQLNNRMLNLDNFYKDSDLEEFCTLSQPKILYFVLHLSKQYQIQSLKLSNNDIHILSPVESIWGMKFLTTLDLRNNLIEEMSELNVLKSMQITELFLDGNPVCDNYDEYSYIRAIRAVCPKIEKLDGVILGQKGYLPFRRNFLSNSETQELIDNFLEHYYNLYDGKDRIALAGLYSNNAMFSLTCQYLPGQTSSASASLAHYKRRSRNLKMLSDLSKSNDFLVTGGGVILKTLQYLPATEHDPYSFTVDLMVATETTYVITVTGAFREPPHIASETAKIYGFTRTFVLRASGYNEFNIVNDQFHITNATSAQQQRAFKVACTKRPKEALTIGPPKTKEDKEEFEEAFKLITSLNLNWSKKCLEECNYDLPKALSMFVDWHKVDKIPFEAFA